MGLDLVELVMSVEERFGITLSDAEVERAATPANLIDIVMAKAQTSAPAVCLMSHASSENHGTVSQLAEFLVAFTPSAGVAPGGRWSRPDVAAIIRQLTIEHLNLSRGAYREDARFVQDLGGG